jgi:hypothetical protein
MALETAKISKMSITWKASFIANKGCEWSWVYSVSRRLFRNSFESRCQQSACIFLKLRSNTEPESFGKVIESLDSFVLMGQSNYCPCLRSWHASLRASAELNQGSSCSFGGSETDPIDLETNMYCRADFVWYLTQFKGSEGSRAP